MELRGELKYRDGKKKELFIKTDSNTLPSLIVGIKKLDADVSVLLTELVVQERLQRGSEDQGDLEANDADDDENDSDEEEEDIKIVSKVPVPEPPAKRPRSLRT